MAMFDLAPRRLRWINKAALAALAAFSCHSFFQSSGHAQALGPAAPHPIWGVDSAAGSCVGGEVGWDARGMIPWQEFAQGEYVGHARTAQVPEYRLREGDQLAVYYRRTRDELSRPYELEVGDRVHIESPIGAGGGETNSSGNQPGPSLYNITRDLVVQPDGTIV